MREGLSDILFTKELLQHTFAKMCGKILAGTCYLNILDILPPNEYVPYDKHISSLFIV